MTPAPWRRCDVEAVVAMYLDGYAFWLIADAVRRSYPDVAELLGRPSVVARIRAAAGK